MGIYAFEPTVLRYIPPDKPMGLDELMATLLAKGLPVFTYPYQGHWVDIGRHEDFGLAMELFEKNQDSFLRER